MNKHPVTVSVERRKDDDNEKLIRRFMKKFKKEGVIQEVMDRRYHVKPSMKRRRKRERAERRRRIEKRKLERESRK